MARHAVAQFKQSGPLRDMSPAGQGRVIGNEEKNFTKVFPESATLYDVWLWLQSAKAFVVALTFENEDSELLRGTQAPPSDSAQ